MTSLKEKNEMSDVYFIHQITFNEMNKVKSEHASVQL